MPPCAPSKKVFPLALLFLLCLGLPGVHPWRSSKFFFIGFNKTGSHTLWKLIQSLGINGCHDFKWAEASRLYWHRYFQRMTECQAFLDGERASFHWLETMFPGSVFVLNTRPLESWLVSRQAYYRHLVFQKYNSPKSPPHLAAAPTDVHKWIEERETYHTRVLQHFLDAETFARLSSGGPLMATTGVIYRHVSRIKDGLSSLFMVVDLITDGEARVRSQLEVLLKESGIRPLAQGAEHGANHGISKQGAGHGIMDVTVGDGVGGSERYEGNPETIAKSKKCIARILNSLALTAKERSTDLLIGRPSLPPLPSGFSELKCLLFQV